MAFADLEAGEQYTASVKSWKSGKSGTKKTPYLEITWDIPAASCTMRSTHYITEKTEDRFLQMMESLKWNYDESFGEGALDTDKLMSLSLEMEHGQDGKDRLKVAWVNDPDEPFGGGAEHDATALKGLNLKAKAAARKAGKGGPMEGQPTFDSTEEIPF